MASLTRRNLAAAQLPANQCLCTSRAWCAQDRAGTKVASMLAAGGAIEARIKDQRAAPPTMHGLEPRPTERAVRSISPGRSAAVWTVECFCAHDEHQCMTLVRRLEVSWAPGTPRGMESEGVAHFSDGIARIYFLSKAMADQLLEFQTSKGSVMGQVCSVQRRVSGTPPLRDGSLGIIDRDPPRSSGVPKARFLESRKRRLPMVLDRSGQVFNFESDMLCSDSAHNFRTPLDHTHGSSGVRSWPARSMPSSSGRPLSGSQVPCSRNGPLCLPEATASGPCPTPQPSPATPHLKSPLDPSTLSPRLPSQAKSPFPTPKNLAIIHPPP